MKRIHNRKVEPRPTLPSQLAGNGTPKEIQKAWESLDKVKLKIHETENKISTSTKPSSSDILYNLPSFLFDLIEPDYKFKKSKVSTDVSNSDTEDISSVQPSNRKVCRISGRKFDDRIVTTEEDSGVKRGFKNSHNENKIIKNESEQFSQKLGREEHSASDSRLHPSSNCTELFADATTSTVVRETSVRVLNDFETSPDPNVVRPRLHHVDVPIVSSRKSNGSDQSSKIKSQQYKVPSRDVVPDENVMPPREDKNINKEERTGVNDGLERVKEMIRRQRHDDDEVIVEKMSNDAAMIQNATPTRKVAAGPNPLTYKGFNRPVSAPATPVRVTKVTFKSDVKQPIGAKSEMNSKQVEEKQGRILAIHEGPASKDLITTRSWRTGLKLEKDLGLTYRLDPQRSKSNAGDPYLSKLKSKTESSKSSFPEPENKILREDTEMKPKTTSTSRIDLEKRRKHKTPEPAKVEKQVRVVHYDTSAARNYMRKKKIEMKKQQKNLLEVEENEKLEKKRRMEELSKRQLEVLAKSIKSTKIEGATIKINNKGSSKERYSPLPEDSEEDDDDDYEEEELEDEDETEVKDEEENLRPQRYIGPVPAARTAPAAFEPRVHHGGKEMSAEEIIERFAFESGLTLNDVVSNYSKYAQDIKHSFVDNGQGSFTSAPTSKGSRRSLATRIASIKKLSDQLQARFRGETNEAARSNGFIQNRNLTKVMDDMQDHNSRIRDAGTRYMNENDIPAEDFSSPNLPGMKAHPVMTSLPVVTRTEERFSRVTESLTYWAIESERNNRLADVDHVMDKYNSKLNDCPVYLRPPLIPLTNISTHSRDTGYLHPVKTVPHWKMLLNETDPYNIINIFNRKQKAKYVQDPVLRRMGGCVVEFLSMKKEEKNKLKTGIENDIVDPPADDGNSTKYLEMPTQISPKHRHHRNELEFQTHVENRSEVVTQTTTERSSEHSDGSEQDDGGQKEKIMLLDDEFESLVSYKEDFTEWSAGVSTSKKQSDPSHADQSNMAGELQSSNTNSEAEHSTFSEVTSLTHTHMSVSMASHQFMHAAHPNLYGSSMISPAALEARMTAELNLLETMDASLAQLTNLERTNSVAAAQQETVSLAQIIRARQQTQSMESEMVRLKVGQESLEEARRLQATMAADRDAEQSTMARLIREAANTSAAVHGSVNQISATQNETAKLTSDAAKRLAEASSLMLEQQMKADDIDATRQLLAESAAAAAAGAATAAVVQHLKSLPGFKSHGHKSSSVKSPLSSARSLRSKSAASFNDAASSKSARSSRYGSEDYSPDEASSVVSVASKRAKKTSRDAISIDSNGVKTATDLSNSARSVSVASDIQIVTDRSRPASAHSINTQSFATAVDESADESIKESVSIETGSSVKSVESHSSAVDEEERSGKDYSLNYESATLTEDDDLEVSLREIVPSESERKKIRKSKKKIDSADGSVASHRRRSDDDSFGRFNVAMVEQYLKEEEVRQHHKEMLLLVRERALKEKTASELAWLEQQNKMSDKRKGTDDVHPKILKKRRSILRHHKQYLKELERLKKANQLSMEAQKLLMTESEGVKYIHKSTAEMKEKLRNAGIDPSVLLLPDLSSNEEDDDDDLSLDASMAEEAMAEGLKLKMKLGQKKLTERERNLLERRKKAEKLLKSDQKKENVGKNVKDLDTNLNGLDSARSVATMDGVSNLTGRSEKSQSRVSKSISENITAQFHSRRASSALTELDVSRKSDDSSTAEEISDAVSAVNSSKSTENSTEVNQSVQKDADYSQAFESATEYTSRVNSMVSATPRAPNKAALNAGKSKPKEDSKGREAKKKYPVSDSDDDFTLNKSVEFSDQSDLEGRIKSLAEQLKQRKKQAESLKKKHEKKKLRSEEERLQNEIKVYNEYIDKVKNDLSTSSQPREATPKQHSNQLQRTSSLTDSSPSDSTVVHDSDANKLSKSVTKESQTSQKKAATDDHISESLVSEHISEDVSTALSSEGKPMLKLDLDDLDELPAAGSQVVTPRSARSEAYVPDSARTLADIPEEYSLHDNVPFSQTSMSKDFLTKPKKDESSERLSARSSGQRSEHTAAESYTRDFSDNDDDTNASEKIVDSPAKSEMKSSVKKSVVESIHTEEDITDDFSTDEESGLKSEPLAALESLSKSHSAKGDGDVKNLETDFKSSELVPGDVTEVPSKLHSTKDGDVHDLEADIVEELLPSEKDVVDFDSDVPIEQEITSLQANQEKYESATNRALDGMVTQAIDDIIGIRKNRGKIEIPEDRGTISEDEKRKNTVKDSVTETTFGAVQDFVYTDDDDDDLDDVYNELTSMRQNDLKIGLKEGQNYFNRQRASVKSPEPEFVVPHNKDDVVSMVSDIIDDLWKSRRPDGTWDTLHWPNFDGKITSDNIVSQSKATYRSLVRDLTMEAICSLFKSDSSVDLPSWHKPKSTSSIQQSLAFQTSAGEVKPAVQDHVLRHLGLDGRVTKPQHRFSSTRLSARQKKSSHLDEVIARELKEEEKEWTNYERDELDVKMLITDSLFDSLLNETISHLTIIKSKVK